MARAAGGVAIIAPSTIPGESALGLPWTENQARYPQLRSQAPGVGALGLPYDSHWISMEINAPMTA
jgi:hypothetical protein